MLDFIRVGVTCLVDILERPALFRGGRDGSLQERGDVCVVGEG